MLNVPVGEEYLLSQTVNNNIPEEVVSFFTFNP